MTCLKNAAYTDKYKEQCVFYEPLFKDEYLQEVEELVLTHGYSILKTSYAGNIHNRNLSGNICRLLDADGLEIHTWKNYDDECSFETIIDHTDGHTYFVYRQDLYGYSVFDLTTNTKFQYLPQCVLDGQEYFIWTNIYYNPLNNMLAVAGCIWGAPWSTLLVDFAYPMNEPRFQFDVIEQIDGDYDRYDDADFVRWEGTKLIINCYNIETLSKEEICLPTESLPPLIL